MRTLVVIAILVTLFSCNNKKSTENTLRLNPEKGKIYRYAVEDKFQIMATTPDGDKEIYTKLLYDYAIQYDLKDSVLNGTLRFENFRIEFEDGNGIQVFDTKFDSASWKNIDLWFYYSLLKRNIPLRFSKEGRVQEIKTVETIKQSLITAYSRNGINTPELTAVLKKFVDNFVVNRMTVENYAFYTGKPLLKDSSFTIGFTALMPLHHAVTYKYNLRNQTDTTLTLGGKGSVQLIDSLKQEFPFSFLKNKQLRTEGFDEVLLQKETNTVQYRKSYFNLADSLLLNGKYFPANIIVEKETKLKKPD